MARINGIVEAVKELGASRVALQFPDSLLEQSWSIVGQLREQLDGVEWFVMADTTYGDCCVDEVAGEHVSADLIVHFGHACLSPTRALPVYYVPEDCEMELDIPNLLGFASELREREAGCVVVVPELCYCEQLSQTDFNTVDDIFLARPPVDLNAVVLPSASNGKQSRFGRYIIPSEADAEGTIFLWVGSPESRTLKSIAVSLSAEKSFIFDPKLGVAGGEVDANRVLRQRFALVEKARNAHRIGLVAGTLSVSGQLELIEHCKRAIAKVDRRCYVLCVGKPTVEKFGNFPEIEVFVLVACPENSLLDPRNFMTPVITPMELLVALTIDDHIDPLTYSADFSKAMLQTIEGNEEADDETDTSPASSATVGKTVAKRQAGTIQVRDEGGAAAFLKTQTWQGMEYSVPKDAPTRAVKGLSGIASGYEGEPENPDGGDLLDW